MNTIILFYNYIHIEDPQALMRDQRALCEKLGLKGRIIIAHEGINATLEGEDSAIEKYCEALLADARFADTHIKKSAGTADLQAFPRLSVKVRKEIVSLGLPEDADIHPREVTGKHLSAEDLHEWFEKGEDFTIVDMRNDYEHASGHFKGSVLPPLHNFRDLPKMLKTSPALANLKNKKVLTVCTGGVRCEKASGFLIKNGFKDVYQLDGGIVTYMEKFENENRSEKTVQNKSTNTTVSSNFLGSIFVFDQRVTMAFASQEKRPVIGTCEVCDGLSEHYTNCANMECHDKFIVCEACMEKKGENHCVKCRSGVTAVAGA